MVTDKPHKRGEQREKNTLLRSYWVLAEMYGLVFRDYQPVSEPPKMPGRIPWGTARLSLLLCIFLLTNYKIRKSNSWFTCAKTGWRVWCMHKIQMLSSSEWVYRDGNLHFYSFCLGDFSLFVFLMLSEQYEGHWSMFIAKKYWRFLKMKTEIIWDC